MAEPDTTELMQCSRKTRICRDMIYGAKPKPDLLQFNTQAPILVLYLTSFRLGLAFWPKSPNKHIEIQFYLMGILPYKVAIWTENFGNCQTDMRK